MNAIVNEKKKVIPTITLVSDNEKKIKAKNQALQEFACVCRVSKVQTCPFYNQGDGAVLADDGI